MAEDKQSAKSLTEWRVVMWLTFLGLAAANVWRMGGAHFDPASVALLCLVVMAINFAAVFANAVGSRTAFYPGFACSILGVVLVMSQPTEMTRRPPDLGNVLVHKIVGGGVGLSVGGLAGISVGYAWDRATRRKP